VSSLVETGAPLQAILYKPRGKLRL